MINKNLITLLILSIFCSCSMVTRLSVGLSLKKHTTTIEEVLKVSNKFSNKVLNIGVTDSTYFTTDMMDSLIYGDKAVTNKRQLYQYLSQPLNCMFFDESNRLIAAYAICDADYINLKLTWSDYLSKPYIVKNVPKEHNVTFEKVMNGIQLLQIAPVEKENLNVVLFWSKVGGRQLKYFLKEFANYFKDKNVNLYIVNCDNAITTIGYKR